MGPLSFVNYKVNCSLVEWPSFAGGLSHSQKTPLFLSSFGLAWGNSEKWKGITLFREDACSLCVVGHLAGAGHPPGPTHPPQSRSVCKGLSGTGSNKQSQAAKMQGLIMQFMGFPGLFVLFPQLPGARQRKVLAKARLALGLEGGLLPGLSECVRGLHALVAPPSTSHSSKENPTHLPPTARVQTHTRTHSGRLLTSPPSSKLLPYFPGG